MKIPKEELEELKLFLQKAKDICEHHDEFCSECPFAIMNKFHTLDCALNEPIEWQLDLINRR